MGTPHSSPSPAVSNDVHPGADETSTLDAPVLDRMDMPGGKPVAVHVNGDVPPRRTPIPRLHLTPIVQSSRLLYVDRSIDGSATGTPITSIDSDLLDETLWLSVTVTKNGAGPDVTNAATVPEIAPDGLNERPVGGMPLNVYGGVPPVAVSVAEYATPFVALGNTPSTPPVMMFNALTRSVRGFHAVSTPSVALNRAV